MKKSFAASLYIKYGSGSPEKNMRKLAEIPVLLIHGTKDTQTQYYHSKILNELGRDNCKLITVEGADHLIIKEDLLSKDSSEYRNYVTGFLKKMAPGDHE